MKNPCYDEVNHKDCPGRHTGCAVDCPAWAEYVRQRDAEYERRRAESDAKWAISNAIEKRVEHHCKHSIKQRSKRKRHYEN